MKRSLRKMCSGGDSTVAEWDTETISEKEIKEIETQYDQLVKEGHTPADITDKRDTLVPGTPFNPEADTLMIPRMVGGTK